MLWLGEPCAFGPRFVTLDLEIAEISPVILCTQNVWQRVKALEARTGWL